MMCGDLSMRPHAIYREMGDYDA
ncbi:hypothetical protein CBM2629_U20032 [Cupriavidus taiwanensis]|nr:hypothetical protein CBM2591_B140002 [Cupriavidus taiwanensis]SPA53869.1 hypothetical protein CBM2629_U20032 [Cupriavidus taiwanensis]